MKLSMLISLALLGALGGWASAEEPLGDGRALQELGSRMRQVGRRAQAASQELAQTPVVFTNVYSRPNDDQFQNASGNHGEPYEVARISTTLQMTPERGGGWQARLIWRAVMTTGRHVEAAPAFSLEVATNPFGGAAPRPVRLAFAYPPGVNAGSTAAQKRGSVMSADMDLGTIPGSPDQTYRGGLVIAFRGTGSERGTEQLEGRAGATFQRLSWEAEVRDGAVARGGITAMRFSDPQVRLIWSSYQNELSTRPYPPEPAEAALLPETIGEGEEELNSLTPIQRATLAVSSIMVTARCISCHDSGNQDRRLFHDSGVPVRPGLFAGQVRSFLGNIDTWAETRHPGAGEEPGRFRYPRAMISRARAISEADRRLILQWANDVEAYLREQERPPARQKPPAR